ncbi:hypothetical protein F1880_007594 [Penicillium rolfsii]|nr:hypothetical protein F1880_007594 [Penicillium rolfsii]
MEQSHSRNRRLVTYGSSKRDNPRSGIAPARVAPAKESPVLPGKIRSSRSSTTEISGNEHRSKKGRSSELVQAPGVLGVSRKTEEDSIYDLPSSDDENPEPHVRRKRRRYGADTNGDAALSHYPFAARSSSDLGAKAGSQDFPIKKDPASSRNTLPRATNQVGRAGPQPANNGGKSKSILQKPVGLSPTDELRRTGPTPIASVDTSRHSSQSKVKQASCGSVRSTPIMEPEFPSPPMRTSTPGGTTTPTRKRLIDSLGTREQSADALSNTTSGSQPPSPFTPRSPSRPKTIPSLSTRADEQTTDSSQEHTVAVSPHLAGSRVTYARQRSFLDDMCLTSGLSGHEGTAGLKQEGLSASQSRGFDDLPRGRLVEIEEVTNEDGSVRSIHELRRAGGNARYRGAIESIFEDIEDSHVSISGRCNSFVQLCDKLLDSKLARQFVECNFEKRLIDCLTNDLDLVSAALALSVFGLASQGRTLPYVLAATTWPKLLDIAPICLEAQDDLCVIVRARNSSLSKAAQRSVQNVAPRIHTALFADKSIPELSPCLLALHCLKATISSFQAKGEIPHGLPGPVLSQLVNILLSEVSHLGEGASNGEERFHLLILGLSILEVHTTSGDPARQEQHDALGVLPDMHGLLRLGNEAGAVRQQVQMLYLRVILNTTNSNRTLCDKFATASMIEELATIAMARFDSLTEDTLAHENNALDTVILALGALINLVEQSETSRTIFLRSTSVPESILDQLLHVFSTHVDSISKADSVLEVHHNVAVGYLAVLLLALCLHTGARTRIKECLRPNGLASIMSTVNEFLQHHQKIEQEMNPAHAKKEASGFLVRLQDLMHEIQRIDNE